MLPLPKSTDIQINKGQVRGNQDLELESPVAGKALHESGKSQRLAIMARSSKVASTSSMEAVIRAAVAVQMEPAALSEDAQAAAAEAAIAAQ